MSKNKQWNSIANVKMPNIDFINKYIINSGINEGGYLVLVNYQSLFSNIFPLAPPPQLYFFMKYRRNRLLGVSFIKQQDFMIYQHETRELQCHH